MSRSEFIIVTALILFGAFLLGWICAWLVRQLSRPAKADLTVLDRMAQQLHLAEEERDAARSTLQDHEAATAARMAGLRAELAAAMEGLRESRSEVEELRDYIERALARR